jgi:hypothetical protein
MFQVSGKVSFYIQIAPHKYALDSFVEAYAFNSRSAVYDVFCINNLNPYYISTFCVFSGGCNGI